MHELICNVLLKRSSNNFQTKLVNDIENLKRSENLLIPADKTTNLCKVMPTPI